MSDEEKGYSFQTATGRFHPPQPPPALWDRKEEMGLVSDATGSAAVRAQCASEAWKIKNACVQIFREAVRGGGVRAWERAYERWECPAGAAQLGAKLGDEVCQSLNVPVLLPGNKSGTAC